jgi:hypothetical protein
MPFGRVRGRYPNNTVKAGRDMNRMKRRDFLKASIGTTVIAGSVFPFAAHRGSAREFTPEAKTKVSAIRGTDLASMTHDAIEALGGMSKIVEKTARQRDRAVRPLT